LSVYGKILIFSYLYFGSTFSKGGLSYKFLVVSILAPPFQKVDKKIEMLF